MRVSSGFGLSKLPVTTIEDAITGYRNIVPKNPVKIIKPQQYALQNEVVHKTSGFFKMKKFFNRMQSK